jgi:hypothetical protein
MQENCVGGILATYPDIQSPANLSAASITSYIYLRDRLTMQARGMIIQRAEAIGLDWDGTLKQLQQQDWEARLQEATDPLVDSYPSYYTQPFHAYKQVRTMS